MSKKLDPFDSPKRRLSRAKQQVSRLEKRIHTFLKKKPHEMVADTDSQGITTHALKFTRDFPDSWADAAVESLEALRSALDQAGYAAARLGGIAEPKNAYFPMADTVADLDAVVRGRCKDLPPDISSLFRGFDAHQGGNYALWALNKLCNANKHRLLVPMGAVGASMTMRHGSITNGVILFPRWNREQNRIELARTNPGGQFKYDGDLSFFIGFDEFNGVKGGPAVGILNTIAGEVKRVLVATEAECRRLGLVS